MQQQQGVIPESKALGVQLACADRDADVVEG